MGRPCWHGGVLIRRAQRATVPRGVDPCNGMWRDRVSPASSGVQTRRVKTAVVGWATAESSAVDRDDGKPPGSARGAEGTVGLSVCAA